MRIVTLDTTGELFDVLEERDLYAVLRNRKTGDEFVVSLRTFRQFRTLTHPCTRMERR